MLEKRPEENSLMDVINCTESTMAISRCLEKDGYCSRNYSDCCKVHKVLLDLQNTYNNRLENVKISDIIQPGKDEYFGRFYVVIKLNLKDQTYECIYSHVHEQDRQKLQEFLASEKLTEHLVDGCMEEDMSYRRICDNEADSYIWMEAKRYVDEIEVVKQHPITGAEMTLRFPNGVTTEKLNEYSYEICRHHHERFDGSGYPDGLKGDQIPICAQVVGLVDAYDALVSERPYKRKLRHGEAVRMIINGECGAFSMKLLQCFLAAAMQKEWVQKVETDTEA